MQRTPGNHASYIWMRGESDKKRSIVNFYATFVPLLKLNWYNVILSNFHLTLPAQWVSVSQWKINVWLIAKWFCCGAKMIVGIFISLILPQTEWNKTKILGAAEKQYLISGECNQSNVSSLHLLIRWKKSTDNKWLYFYSQGESQSAAGAEQLIPPPLLRMSCFTQHSSYNSSSSREDYSYSSILCKRVMVPLIQMAVWIRSHQPFWTH